MRKQRVRQRKAQRMDNEATPILSHASSTDLEKRRHAVPERTITVFGLIAFAYVCNGGGPFGMEAAVQGGGALLTLLGIVVLSVTWAAPQALITAEMATTFPHNGGCIEWTREGLGRYWTFVGGFNSVASNVIDLPIYPVLFAGYISQLFPQISSPVLTLMKYVVLVAVMCFNIKGLECVSITSTIFSILIMLPFVVEPFLLSHWEPAVWGKTAEPIDWSVYMSSILWNFQGWDSLGSIAGEVKNGKVTYPVGIVCAIALISAFYALPVMVGTCVQPDFALWDDGYFVTVGQMLHKWMGYWVTLAGVIAMLSQFNASMSTYSRMTQAVANLRMLPEVLTWNPEPYATPIPAIILHSLFTAVLMNFSFESLIVLDATFKNTALLLEFGSFLVLKYRKPDLERPYVVPCGKIGAWAVTLPCFTIIGYAYYSVGWTVELGVWAGVELLLLACAWLWVRHVPESAAQVYTAIKEPEHLVVCDDGGAGIELESRQE